MSVLETLDFQPMLVTDVFDSLTTSKAWYDKNKIQAGPGAYPYVSRSRLANGHESVVGRQDLPPNAGNAITIGVDTQSVFYQPTPFYTSVKIQVLRHSRMTTASALVLVALLREQMMKFQWGNGVSLDRLQATRIMVPTFTNADGTIEAAWDGMDRLGAELLDQVITHTHSARETRLDDDDTLPELRFAPIRLDALFRFYRGAVGKRVTGGRTVYIGAAARRNSVVGYVNDDPTFPGGRLAIVNNGDGGAGYCTYQPMPFSASSDVTVLEPLENNIPGDALLLLSSCITYQCFPKYSFGYKPNQRRLAAQEIMVPVVTNASGEDVVDWEGMASYGRALRVRAERAIVPVVGSLS